MQKSEEYKTALSSYDVRVSEDGTLNVVDANAFPAGLNNVDKDDLINFGRSQWFKDYISQYKKIIIISENKGTISTNPQYYQNLLSWKQMLEEAGLKQGENFIFAVHGDVSVKPEVHNNFDQKEKESYEKLLKEDGMLQVLKNLNIISFNPNDFEDKANTLIISNSDGANTRIPLEKIKQDVKGFTTKNGYPNTTWIERKKNTFFNFYNTLIKQQYDTTKHKELKTKTKQASIVINGSGKITNYESLAKAIIKTIVSEAKLQALKEHNISDDGEVFTVFIKLNGISSDVSVETKSVETKILKTVPTFGAGVVPISFTISKNAIKQLKSQALKYEEDTTSSPTKPDGREIAFWKTALIHEEVINRLNELNTKKIELSGGKIPFWKAFFGTTKQDVIVQPGKGFKEFTLYGFEDKIVGAFLRTNEGAEESLKNQESKNKTQINLNQTGQHFTPIPTYNNASFLITDTLSINDKDIKEQLGLYHSAFNDEITKVDDAKKESNQTTKNGVKI